MQAAALGTLEAWGEQEPSQAPWPAFSILNRWLRLDSHLSQRDQGQDESCVCSYFEAAVTCDQGRLPARDPAQPTETALGLG